MTRLGLNTIKIKFIIVFFKDYILWFFEINLKGCKDRLFIKFSAKEINFQLG